MRWGSMAVLIVFMAVYGTVTVDNSKPRNPGIGETKNTRIYTYFSANDSGSNNLCQCY